MLNICYVDTTKYDKAIITINDMNRLEADAVVDNLTRFGFICSFICDENGAFSVTIWDCARQCRGK
jgi:hypothetical protein